MNSQSLLVNAAPLILAALGGLLSEWAGLLNIGLEGFMLLGAFLAVAGAHASAFWPVGLLYGLSLAALGGICLGWLMSWAAIKRKANIFIVGLAVNLLAASLVSFGGSWLFHTRSVVVLGPGQTMPSGFFDLFVPLACLALAAVFWHGSRSTVSGLRLRVLGSDAPMLAARGIDTAALSRQALVLSAMLASLSGAVLSLELGAFVPNQSSGRGWIALVLVFVGGRHPLGIALACLAYAFLEQLSVNAQAGLEHPALLVGLPYLLVFAALLAAETMRRLFRLRRT